jgi:hypothetical protein
MILGYIFSMFKAFQSMEEYNKILIHHDHEWMVGTMTPQELLQQLKNEGDSTHTAISIYLET